ncbi:MAG: hypothetical protein ACM3QW_02555 [Ignavibacteriales bacterium]
MNNFGSPKTSTRFRTPEQLQSFLEREANGDFRFHAYPISGEPETFHYSGGKNIVREADGTSFDSLGDFTCYAFQCDAEGYAGTEYVDIEVLK